jgi:hypothetical protein
MTITEIQDEIIIDFSLLDGDMEMTVFYIMELGQKLPKCLKVTRRKIICQRLPVESMVDINT